MSSGRAAVQQILNLSAMINAPVLGVRGGKLATVGRLSYYRHQ